MLTDIDKEFDTPIEDENGELIETIEIEEVFEEDTGLEEKEDSFYELAEDDITQEVEEFNSIEEDIVSGKENYEEAKQQLVDIFTSILEKGEITAEDNTEIEQVKEQYSEAYNSIKENTENVQKKTLEERLEELKEGMVGATTDDILNILTEGGTKCWLYKDDDNNVLMDGTSIPELTMLVNKLNLIATGGDDEQAEIQLTPEFINMVVKESGNGDSVKSVVTKYYLSTSREELINGSWVDTLPSTAEQQGKFLWYKIVTTYVDETKEPTETQPICISAKDGKDGTGINIIDKLTSTSQLPATGNKGDCYTVNGVLYVWSVDVNNWIDAGNIKGEQGEPGVSSYLHIKYSDDGKTFTANDGETVGIYIGILVNNTVADSINFNDYTWSRIRGDQGLQGIQGEKGEQGIKGDKGDPGRTTYFHIKYSSNANGNPMTEIPSEYIGTYVDYTEADSTDYTKYTWARLQGLQGEKGDQGIPGNNGSDGLTYYLHIKYSNDGGKTFTANNGETAGTYIGVYTDTTQSDSTSVSSYTWSKIKGETGDKGDQGNPGEDGRGVEEVVIQYAKNQSTTTAPTSGWSTSMPTYEEGYYLWMRTRIKYTDSAEYEYSTPVCDQSWKANQEVYTQYKQLSDKFTWIVKSGTSESTMQLTDTLFELISNTITLTAEHINLNGYVSNDNANWSIDNEGNMRVENLKVDGDISGDSLTVNYIDNPCYPATLAGSVELLVNADIGNDDYTIDDILQSYDEAEEKNDDSLKKRYKTIQGAIDAMPKFLNNKTVHITMETNSTEDVYIRGVVAGAVRIYMNGKTLYGTLRTFSCAAPVYVYGGTKDSNTSATGTIHPKVGLSFASRAVSIGFEACQYIGLYKLKVYAPDSLPSDVTNTDKVCIGSQSGTGAVYCSDIQIVNAVVGFRTNNCGNMHISKSSGIASKYGFQSVTGGRISIASSNQAGGVTSPTNKSSGGQIWYDTNGVTFASGDKTEDSTTAPTPITTKTVTIKSTYGDTYRSTVYNSWKKDGSARQGDYGYGDCTGAWFFGTAFSELKGTTISKVTITITRNSGGSSSAVGLAVKTHNYSARPSGAPTLGTSCGTLSLATGSTGTLTITNSTVLNGISAGTVKGFAIRSTYDSAHYAVCSGNATVKITYK